MTPHGHRGAVTHDNQEERLMNSPTQEPLRLAVISAGISDPSSTRLLADRIADRSSELAACHGRTVTSGVIELREISADICTALISQIITPRLQTSLAAVGEAD